MVQIAVDESFLKVSEVAKILGITYITAYRFVRHGKIPAIRVGKMLRVKRSDLEAWTKELEITPKEAKTLIEAL